MNRNKKDKQKETKEEPGKKVIRDQIYKYDEEHVKTLYKEKPWEKNIKFFKKVKISALAATKMLKHALAGVKKGREGPGGTPIEIMGLLVGKPEGETVVVLDSCPLPVEGIEYKVEAAEEAQVYMTTLSDSIEKRRPEAFIGWYHSHPFDVDVKPHYFMSSMDVTTQALWQHTSPVWTAIVIDPLRSLAKQEPQLGCFRVYPPSHCPKPTEGPDGRIYASEEAVKIRWGSSPNRYYKLDHSYFLSTFGARVVEMMSRNNLWIRVLSSSAILEPENRLRFPERLTKAKDKLRAASNQQRGQYPGIMMQPHGRRGSGGYGAAKKDAAMTEGATQFAELAIEQCNGHASQISKNILFNFKKETSNSNVEEEVKDEKKSP